MTKELVAEPTDAARYIVQAGALTDAELRQLQEHGNEDGFVTEVTDSLGDINTFQPDQAAIGLDRSDDAASSATGLQTRVREYVRNLAAWGVL